MPPPGGPPSAGLRHLVLLFLHPSPPTPRVLRFQSVAPDPRLQPLTPALLTHPVPWRGDPLGLLDFPQSCSHGHQLLARLRAQSSLSARVLRYRDGRATGNECRDDLRLCRRDLPLQRTVRYSRGAPAAQQNPRSRLDAVVNRLEGGQCEDAAASTVLSPGPRPRAGQFRFQNSRHPGLRA